MTIASATDGKDWVKIGYTWAERLAESYNAGNGNSFAAQTLAHHLSNLHLGRIGAKDQNWQWVMQMTAKCRIDLIEFWAITDESTWVRAISLIVAGASKFAAENPD